MARSQVRSHKRRVSKVAASARALHSRANVVEILINIVAMLDGLSPPDDVSIVKIRLCIVESF